MQGLTFSSHINAWALYEAGKRLNVNIRTTDKIAPFPIPFGEANFADQWLLFTEELSLGKALTGQLPGRFLPKQFPLNLLDDKFAFSEWLTRQSGLTPSLRYCSLITRVSVPFPLLLKAKHSWHDAKKLPRGWVCRDKIELDYRLTNLAAEGYSSDCFFLQEWLGDSSMRLLSVCGFFDVIQHERNLTCIVERLASYEVGPSCSSIVATLNDEWGLTEKAFAILRRLEFVGPFEMEFIVTKDRVVVLELNPRFWMQHALFLIDGNGLLKRYFGLDTEQDRQQKNIGKILWIDGAFLVSNLAKLKFNLVKIILKKYQENYKLLIWPTIFSTFRFLTYKILKKLFCTKAH